MLLPTSGAVDLFEKTWAGVRTSLVARQGILVPFESTKRHYQGRRQPIERTTLRSTSALLADRTRKRPTEWYITYISVENHGHNQAGFFLGRETHFILINGHAATFQSASQKVFGFTPSEFCYHLSFLAAVSLARVVEEERSTHNFRISLEVQ